METRVYIMRRFSGYEQEIKNIVGNCKSFITDSRCRPENNDIQKSDQSILLLEEYDSERQSPIEWLQFITKNICISSDKVLVLIYINEQNRSLYDTINNELFKIECMRLTVDD